MSCYCQRDGCCVFVNYLLRRVLRREPKFLRGADLGITPPGNIAAKSVSFCSSRSTALWRLAIFSAWVVASGFFASSSSFWRAAGTGPGTKLG